MLKASVLLRGGEAACALCPLKKENFTSSQQVSKALAHRQLMVVCHSERCINNVTVSALCTITTKTS